MQHGFRQYLPGRLGGEPEDAGLGFAVRHAPARWKQPENRGIGHQRRREALGHFDHPLERDVGKARLVLGITAADVEMVVGGLNQRPLSRLGLVSLVLPTSRGRRRPGVR